jgi:hypothetical protein
MWLALSGICEAISVKLCIAESSVHLLEKKRRVKVFQCKSAPCLWCLLRCLLTLPSESAQALTRAALYLFVRRAAFC